MAVGSIAPAALRSAAWRLLLTAFTALSAFSLMRIVLAHVGFFLLFFVGGAGSDPEGIFPVILGHEVKEKKKKKATFDFDVALAV